MGLQLYVSNSLKELSTKLNEAIKSNKPDVFEPYHIVTQTEGMNNWLKLQIAGDTQIGIAANLKFLKPNDLIHKAYCLLGGKLTGTLSSENLCWLLFKILGEEDFIQKFPVIAAYYTGEEPNQAVKRMGLSRKMADLFDQYQIYRDDYIANWNKDIVKEGDLNEQWQKYLWLRAKALAGDKMPDKAEQSNFILQQLQCPEKGEMLWSLLPEVHLFGISITTPYHLKILEELSRYINISFYIQNPAPSEYWLDTISEKQQLILERKGVAHSETVTLGNSLLLSWGKMVRDTFCLCFEYDEFLNAYTEVGVKEPGTDTLLHKIQSDLFHNRYQADRSTINLTQVQDGSITINSCYTIAREVEVLYNYLVHLVDQRKEVLSPRDIVVMVSDIDAYAPYIKAVFNNAPFKFRFSIADESFISGDTIINALKAVMEITEHNFQAENVVQLLDSAYIRKRFGLSNTSLIRRLVDKANIRFGIEGSSEDDSVYVSWKYGIQRMMFGICMSGDDEYLVGGDTLFPLDTLEGSESQELIRFCHFVQVLIDAIDQRKEARTIVDWIMYVKLLLQNLVYEVGDTVDEEFIVLEKQLESYHELDQVLDERLPYDVFCYSFQQSISSITRTSAFANGGITFCSLIPMRSIPFKVVALLGLNFDKFPRKETAASFNLMEVKKRKGDRSVKDNDKHLFLETLLSAQEHFYISYQGQSVKDNTTIPPSALVDELIDYIEAKFDGTDNLRKTMITLHPLHSFSRRYAIGNGRLYNYIIDKPGEITGLLQFDKQRDPFKPEEVTIGEMISFFKNPFKAYYNKVLGIWYDDETELLGDKELFGLDHLQEWSLKQALLGLKEEEQEQFKNKWLKTGKLPLKNMAEITIRSTQEKVNPVRELLIKTVGTSTPSVATVEVELTNVLLKGVIHSIYDNNLVFICFSKGEWKYQIEAYIQYLAGRAAGVLEGLFFISAQKEQAYAATPITQQEAQNTLKGLVDLYIKGHNQIIAFYPEFRVKPEKIDNLDLKGFQGIVNNKLKNYLYPCNDEYIMREYGNGYFEGSGILDEFKDNCRLLLSPLTQLFPTYYQ